VRPASARRSSSIGTSDHVVDAYDRGVSVDGSSTHQRSTAASSTNRASCSTTWGPSAKRPPSAVYQRAPRSALRQTPVGVDTSITARPPGASHDDMRRSTRAASVGSKVLSSPNSITTRSNVPSIGAFRTSPSTKRDATPARCVACAMAAGETSRPTHVHPARSNRSRCRPGPQPRSSTLAGSAAASDRSAATSASIVAGRRLARSCQSVRCSRSMRALKSGAPHGRRGPGWSESRSTIGRRSTVSVLRLAQTSCLVSSATSSKFFLMSGRDWVPSR